MLDHQLALRGVTARRLAEVAGVPEPSLSRARHGRPVSELTLRRLTKGLLSIPLMLGADLLVAAPETNKRPSDHSQALATEADGGTNTAAPTPV